MDTPTQILEEYFSGLMTIVDQSTKSQADQILMAGAMMAVAKMLYHNNLTEQEYNNIVNHNVRDLINLIKPTIH
jgi:hypothetical protein|tara:strand:- start:165 stop:386 length:222 start_codon:yes stop_codon:yes gene_type:complete